MEISFGYSHYLKTYWYQGGLPSVKYGMYGGRLKKKGPNKTTLEHIRPHSQGGPTTIDNLSLATSRNNNRRGCKPLQDVLNIEVVANYLKQFKGVLYKKLDGNKYIQLILATLENLGVDVGQIRKAL